MEPSIRLRTPNNETHTLLEANNSIFKLLTSVRFFMSNEPQVQFGLKAGVNRTLFFESMGAVRPSAILMENMRTTRNCLQGLPYSLLNGSSPRYNPVLHDGESRFAIITKKQKKITLVLKQQGNRSEFCICWNKTDNSVYLSNTPCVSCPLLPTCVPHFLSLVYEKDQISKTLQINGTDIAIKNASRHLTFKTEKDEGDVYVVHDLREFDATSGRQPRPKGDYDFEGPSSGYNEVVPLLIGIAVIVSLTIKLIICFKRRPCRNEAPSHA
ncbi:uncharacterized protein LOC135199133 [Macrobrachium nipponense]|uniref:uncharacterized protein LOC135199133 n=1 Tax=Macrobrachium nipponense TaxID=159736 RepID=UPI0030C89726